MLQQSPIAIQVKNLEFIFTMADALWSSEQRCALSELIILGPIALGHSSHLGSGLFVPVSEL